jgi:CMP-N,N'-diacetyllegionaminic acid synthase
MNITHKILAIIPARAGSKRVQGKNIKPLHGKPLVCYVMEAALKSSCITRVVVSSDSNEVLELAVKYPNIYFIERPAELADDHSPAIDYVKHTLQMLKEEFDMVVILQPSSPLTLPDDIDGTINLLLQHPEADSSVSVMKLDHAIHPVKMKVMKNDILLPYLEEENGRMAAHELPELYVRNCSVYVSRCSTIDGGKIIGEHCMGFLMPRERSVDINDPIDFAFAEFLIQQRNLL